MNLAGGLKPYSTMAATGAMKDHSHLLWGAPHVLRRCWFGSVRCPSVHVHEAWRAPYLVVLGVV